MREIPLDYPIRSITVSGDHKNWLICNGSPIAILTDSQGQTIKELKGHQKSVISATFSPDGNWIYTGSADKSIILWDKNGRLIHSLNGHKSYVQDLVCTDNDLYSVGGKSLFQWWRARKIYQWLQTAPIYPLNDDEKSSFGLLF